MTDFDKSKIAPDIYDFIERAGELEEASASVGLREAFGRESLETPDTPIAPTSLPALQFKIDPKTVRFDLELAQDFIDGPDLQWKQTPIEFLDWLKSELSTGSISRTQIHFGLGKVKPVTQYTYDSSDFTYISSTRLGDTLDQLTACGLLHTEQGIDVSGSDRYPAEKFFFNIDREAQKFLADLFEDSKETIELVIDENFIVALKDLLSNKVQFKGTSGLISFLEQFDVPSSQAIGASTILLQLEDFSLNTRYLIDTVLNHATVANILTQNDRDLYYLSSGGKALLNQLSQDKAA